MKKIFLSVLCFSSLMALQEHEEWWQQCLDKQVLKDNFGMVWGGSPKQVSRVRMREHVKKMNYHSILDVPCGLCMDYFGFKEGNISIEYLGVDITPKIIEIAKENNIPVIEGNIENLPFEDSRFDICYSRHILEHLPDYKKPVSELIRVAKKEVLIVFFIPPNKEIQTTSTKKGYYSNHLLYHNTYSLPQIESFLKLQTKVLSFEWEDVLEDGVTLHIFLKE